jgi:hemerythrin
MPDPASHYLLGLPEMDEQHSYLYRIFSRLEDALHVTNKAGAKALLAEIERYVLFHFACEEQLMRHYGFSGFAVHQADHEKFEARLLQFLDDFEAGRLSPAYAKAALIGWLDEHSRLSDSEYVSWVKKCRAEMQLLWK